ncbi:MAG: TldD/PmbA family protein [Candidatus Bathyarchaeota archaeon]|nr:TldD/PmbA family protein [Candidatus Bathyarchaeota archaeon]
MSDFADELEKLLEKAGTLGSSYVEVMYQKFVSERIDIDNKALKSYNSESFNGLAVRLIHEGSLGYASTTQMTEDGFVRTLERAVKGAKSKPAKEDDPLRSIGVTVTDMALPMKVNPLDVSPEEKVELALDTNKAAWNDDHISATTTQLRLMIDERLFISTDGAKIKVATPLVGVGHRSVAEASGVKEAIWDSRSMCAGYEFITHQDWSKFSAEVSDLAVRSVTCKTAPAGVHPVVVDQDMVGLVLHEALGHATEGDTVVTGGSVLMGRVGTRIASDLVTLVDEGVVEGGYYLPYDDEGVKKKKTVLVDDGVLKSYLTDRRSARKLDVDSTGNGRVQDFENSPLVRQTNYYMAPGDHSLEELVEEVDFGVLIHGRGSRGGQVDPGMGTFTFSVGPSRIIRRGRVAELVRGVVISGSVLDVLETVDAVGKDFNVKTDAFTACGKGGQHVRTGMGGPPIRIRNMTIGGS